MSDLSCELDYMHSHGGPGANLVLGTAPFNGGQVPVDTNHLVDDPVGGLRNFFGF